MAELFAAILKKRSQMSGRMKEKVSKVVENYKLVNYFCQYSPHDIPIALWKLKVNSSPDDDQIHNLLPKKLPFEYMDDKWTLFWKWEARWSAICKGTSEGFAKG